MNFLAYLRSVSSKFLHHSRTAGEMEDELCSHVQLRADDLQRTGMSRVEAERRARIEFGGFERYREESHHALGGSFIEILLNDVRISYRKLRKSPGFTLVASLTLALAIGANAVVFAVLNGLILRPINVPRPASLYGLERGSYKAVNHSYPDYLDFRNRNRTFEDLAAYNVTSVGLDTGSGDPVGSWIMETTPNYFDALGIQPYLGRLFHASDDHGPNSVPYIVLTHAFWHSHFHDDPSVVGRVVQLNKHPFTILGVAPPDFRGTILFVFPDFWVPLTNQEQVEGVYDLNERGKRNLLMVFGHLKPGVTPAQAVADLNSVGAYLEANYPRDDSQMYFTLTRPGLAGDWFGGPLRQFLSGLMLLAGLILLAACANLGNLFAARAADRSREISLRLALGSSRFRVVRTLFTEALMISALGGVVGLWGSIVILRALSTWQPLPTAPLTIPISPDAKVYFFALLLALASGLVFGAVPARQTFRTNPYELVKSSSGYRTGRRMTVREVLLVVQIAICAVLVTSSFVAVRGLVRSLHANLGFEPRNAMLVETALSMAGYSGDAVPAMQKRMIDALQAIPGVQSVGLVDRLPLYYGANYTNIFSDKTSDLRPSNVAARPTMYLISPEYFQAAGTSLLSGRAFTWHDDTSAPRVAVINRQFARKIFGSVSAAVGGYFKMENVTRVQVIGIVEDGKYDTLAEEPRAAMFLPILQSPSTQTALVIRSERDQQEIAAAIKRTVTGLDSGLPITLRSWNQELESALFASRMATLSLGVLGTLGAMLAVTGIFGMAAYSVSKRLREFGIRVALGAKRAELLHTALGRALKLLAFGSAAGLFLGILATKVLAYIVYQATPNDPMVLGGAVLAMSLLGLLASWIPARRALNVDPNLLLREE